VSAFIRNKLTSTENPGSSPCVFIDIQNEIDSQINNNRRRILKKQQSQNWTTEFSNVKPDEFKKLCHETMTRLNAKDEYFFDKEYFESIANIDGVFQTNIIDNNTKQTICSGIIFEQGEYHLGATSNDYVKDSPSTLMLYKSAKYLQQKNTATKLNLGGGNENLLRFKQSFSKNLQYFEVTKMILNQSKYHDLTELNYLRKASTNNNFPAYRG
jgi:hypothetical protein